MGLYLHAPVGEIERFDLHGWMRLHIAIPEEEWPAFEQSALLRQIRAYAGPVRITAWYADNAICCREATFYVPGRRWCEFQASALCRALETYVRALGIRYNPPKPGGRREANGLMKQQEKGLKRTRVMLHDQPADKTEEAEKRVEAELKPRPARILTPAFLRGLIARALLGFALGALAGFALKLLLVF